MSVETTVARLNEMKAELEAATGVTEVEIPGPPEGTTAMVAGEFSCERLELIVEEHVKSVTDIIKAKAEEIAALMSNYAPILSVPSNPLKIISWAKKVVSGIAGPAVAAAIELAIDIAQLAGAIAGLAAAAASAAARLANCLTNLVLDTMNTLKNTLLENAVKLYDQALGIYESLKDQVLEDLGYNEILELKDDVLGKVDGLMDTVGDIESSVTSIQDSADTLSNITIPGDI